MKLTTVRIWVAAGLFAGLLLSTLAAAPAQAATEPAFPSSSAGKVYLVDGLNNVSYAAGTTMDWDTDQGAYLSAVATTTTPTDYETVRLPAVSGADQAVTFISSPGKETSRSDWLGYGDLVDLGGKGVLLPQVTPAYQSNGPSLDSVKSSGGDYSLGVAYVKDNAMTVVSSYFTSINVDAGTGAWKFATPSSKAGATIALKASTASAATGTAVQFTATITPSSATGTVQFRDGSTVLGTSAAAGGVASFSTSTLAAGSHTITAVYAGDSSHDPATSAAVTVTVSGLAFTTASAPKISGKAVVDAKLAAGTSAWVPTASLTYQWLLNGKPIDKATGTSLSLAGSYAGGTISVQVTGSRSGYQSLTKTSSGVKVAKATFTKKVTPKISGKAKVGKKLTAVPGTWSPKAAFSYQWLANGKSIKAATSSAFTLTSAQKGKKITVKVTGSRGGYTSVTVTSKATSKVAK